MARKPDLELDLHAKIFDDARERQELHSQIGQLSPRRTATDGGFATTTPFYEDITPGDALDQLFRWFHVSSPDEVADDDDAKGDGNGGDRGEEGEEELEAGRRRVAISREEFNRLRRCIGKPVVTEREWKRALEELGAPAEEERVRKRDFKALFGPPPFFGSEKVQGIVRFIMGAEEHIHFATILLDRFGVDPSGGAKVIGLAELQEIQRACCLDEIYGEREWKELMKKLMLPDTHLYLDWMQFCEAFSVSLRNRRVFGAFADPPAVVYAVLANEKVLETIKNPNETIVSRKAITNLLRLKKTKVDDEKWMKLLESMQTRYEYRKGRRPRKDSAADGRGNEDEDAAHHVHESPLVVVRNTRNQVLSYEITFDEHGPVGLTLQSDFYGHCLTVKDIEGQAAKHSIVATHDIVAAIERNNRKVNLIFDTPADGVDEELQRIKIGMDELEGDGIRKITFHRQECYFMYQDGVMHVSLKTIDDLPPNGKIVLQLPDGASWAPTSYTPGQEAECLEVTFDKEQEGDSDLDLSTIVWRPDSRSVEISLPQTVMIAKNSGIFLHISGLSCGDERLVGPCDVSASSEPLRPVTAAPDMESGSSEPPGGVDDVETVPSLAVSLCLDWKSRETLVQQNPTRARVRQVDDYFDSALEPILANFNPGDSGITLASDFFGQCAVVEKVKELSQAAGFKIEKHDILSSIVIVGEKDSLDVLNCIKPFSLSKKNAKTHIEDIRKRLTECHNSRRMYRLQFLRLNAHFFHNNGRTIFSVNARTTLSDGSAIVVKMPSAKWHVVGPLTANVVHPSEIVIRELFWDSQHQKLHMILDKCSLPEKTTLTFEILGISSGHGEQCAGPGEIVGVHVGDVSVTPQTVPEMEVELHQHWHSFVVGHQGLEASKVVETLKQFDTSPAKLWEVLEYTSLLFDMYKKSESEHLTLSDLNRVVKIVCGDNKQITMEAWNELCRNLGAKPLTGLTRRQFACCWYDVVGLSSFSAKDTYVRLHTAERIFNEIVDIYQDSDEKEYVSDDTIERLAKVVGMSGDMKRKALKSIRDQRLPGWNCDTFSQILCGSHSVVRFDEKDAVALWTRLYYSKKLFSVYSFKKQMRKKNLSELLAAARVTKPKLTNELWSEVCDSVEIDDNGGLKLADFLDVYAGELLGSRHAVADWYRIETFKLLPEKRGKEESSKEAALNVAPEKVNVKDIASKVLEDMASTEELFQDLLDKKLEFSKLEEVTERESESFTFESNFVAKKLSRNKGFLNIELRSISELADHIIQRDPTFNKENTAEELYVMLEVTNSQGLKFRLPKSADRSRCAPFLDKLFGETDHSKDYVIRDDELYDQRETQNRMRRMHDAEKVLKASKVGTAEYQSALNELKNLEKQLIPAKYGGNESFDGKVFSSLIPRDPSPDAIIRFPDDQFRLYVEVPNEKEAQQLYVVCKLFKRVGSDVSRAQLKLNLEVEALKKADGTFKVLEDLVEQQESHLRHLIAEKYAGGSNTTTDSSIWLSVAKLKQKRADLAEFEVEVNKRKAKVEKLTTKLNQANAKAEQDLALLRQTQTGAEGAPQAEVQNDMTTPSTKKTQKKLEDERKDALKRIKKRADAQKVKFIGQAFFELGDLLHVLHDDKEHTVDLAVFRTEHHNDVGILLMHIQYKCASLQMEAPATSLTRITVASTDTNEKTGDSESTEEVALEYPSHSHLELEWKSDVLKEGDRLCLIREGDQFKISMPFFLLLWSPNGVQQAGGSAKDKKGDTSGDEANAACDWWVPDVLTKVYSASADKLVTTDPSKRSGNLHLPSSIDLSLPPGTYKLYLLRNETDENGANFRTVLGKTAALAVLPGVNSVHTSFGTTPLIDVKPISASLQVFAEVDRATVSSSLTNRDGYRNPQYVKQIAVEQELEVARRELRSAQLEADRIKAKKDNKTLTQKIAHLQMIVEDLSQQKIDILTRPVGPDDVGVSLSSSTGVARAQTVFSSSQPLVFSYRFHGGSPSASDRIVVLPADVVRVSDLLRSTILGKLQANDPQQVERARVSMETELLEVQEFFNARFSWKSIKKVLSRAIKPFLRAGRGAGATDKSDAYNAATEATDGSFVWEECMNAYSNSSKIAKGCFSYIIRDLLDEIAARKHQLGLKTLVGSNGKKNRLGKANSLMKVGIEIDVPYHQLTTTNQISDTSDVLGEISTTLGSRFRQGGFYVAKYVRRSSDIPAAPNQSTAGELCRFGPFFVEPARFSFSVGQVAFAIAKTVIKAAMSDQGKLTMKVMGQLYLSLIKYFLAVVSLSFNISVLAGNFNIDVSHLKSLLADFQAKLATFFGPIEVALSTIYEFFNGYIQQLMEKLDFFDVAGECMTGFFLYIILLLLFAATFVVYVVVQEDLLLKIQKLHTILPFNPGKGALGFLEQVGGLLVIPMYLTIKSCVLFISGNWSLVYHRLNDDPSTTLAKFGLYNDASGTCPDGDFAKINYGFGIAALVLIVIFLFICLPLLLLDLFSWVPLSELEDSDTRKKLAHSYDRQDIKAAIHSNADLVEMRRYCPKRCLPRKCAPCLGNFERHYSDYTSMSFRELLKKYGVIWLFCIFVNIYAHLMLQSMIRSIGVLAGWRLREESMYKNKRTMPSSKWKIVDVFCFRFNIAWKLQYIKDKMVMPFVNICMVTLGLWGESQSKEFNIEQRAEDCYRMEPSGEIKQLQMMALHGKIISLFWLCVPETMVLAYLAEVLNRGPVFSYFLNKQFLQADIPDSEREKDPVWRFHTVLAFQGEEDVVYLSDTRFISTLCKWSSSIVEIVSLLMVYPPAAKNRTVLLGITLISAVVTPILEFNQQIIKAYMDYVETAEDLVASTGLMDKLEKAKKLVDAAKELKEDIPEVQVNLRSRGAAQQPPVTTGTASSSTKSQAAQNGVGNAGPPGVQTPATPNPSAHTTTKGAMLASQLIGTDRSLEFGSDGTGIGEEINSKVDEAKDDMLDEAKEAAGDDETAAAAVVAASGLLASKKSLILLKAMPEVSYVVLTDALDVGEGEATINWQINARQRFHALDAIGMFPARAPGDFTIRTMEDCICYRLLKDKDAEPFGWNPDAENEDVERELIIRQARSLRNISEQEVSRITNTSLHNREDDSDVRADKHQERLHLAKTTITTMMQSPKLKPYKKKLNDILEEEVIENKIHLTSPRTSRAFSKAAATLEEAAKKARKVVSGQAKFRPANNCVPEDSEEFETFIYGNDAGIYQSKYGLHGYEFCYLRYNDPDIKVVGLGDEKTKANGKEKTPKVVPLEVRSKNYEIMERFVSNPIQIGTFNIFMNLTCDQPLVGSNETLNLSWIIYGVAHSILSNPKSRNCIGFYKVDDSNSSVCTKIDIIPPSAYLQADENEPCPGRMMVKTPKEPGIYEIRFLFNFFKKAQLHRQCQVFGELEDEMQQLRIRSFYEKRAVTEELRKFSNRDPKTWGYARMNTFAWLKSMLLSTLREPVEPSVMESTSEYSEHMLARLKRKLNQGLVSNSPVYQRRLGQIIAPFRLGAFMDVLSVALQSNSQMNDQLASITFMSPTDDDEKKRGVNPARDSLLLPSDRDLLLFGNISFRPLAINYLNTPSLCGYHDFVDDIVLNHGQMRQTVDQVMNNISSSCLTLYESAIVGAVEEMMKEAKILNLSNALQGIDIMLTDLCRNHIQSIIRAFLETDCRTGKRWPGPPPGSFERITALRLGSAGLDLDDDGSIEPKVGQPPVTREYVAVRRWIRPKLEMKIVAILKQRHARLLSGNIPILRQMLVSCVRPGLSLAGNPFPDHRRLKTRSPLYFLEESRDPALSQAKSASAKKKKEKEEDPAEGGDVQEDVNEGEDDNQAEEAAREAEDREKNAEEAQEDQQQQHDANEDPPEQEGQEPLQEEDGPQGIEEEAPTEDGGAE